MSTNLLFNILYAIFLTYCYIFLIFGAKMNIGRKISLGVTVLCCFIILGFIKFYKLPVSLTILELVQMGLAILIVIFSISSGIKRDKEEKKGFPLSDELSDFLKYKTGYYSFIASFFIWIFILIFRATMFPEVETAIGWGILLSALSSFIIKFNIRKRFNEQ